MDAGVKLPFYQHKDPRIGKAQIIRLWDIFALAPAMIYVGVSGKVPQSWRKWAIIGGILTVVYNAQNYKRVKEWDEKKSS